MVHSAISGTVSLKTSDDGDEVRSGADAPKWDAGPVIPAADAPIT